MGKIIGIDLGTTSSRVAVMEQGRPVIIENSEGEGTTPSYIAIPETGPRLVGEAALRYALANPDRVVFAAKRLIGRRYTDPEVAQMARFMPFHIVEAKNGDAWIQIGTRLYSPAQITASVIQKMMKTAQEFIQEDIEGAVLSVPATFDEQQRRSVIDAADIAGLKVLRIIAEPTLAAVAYGINRQDDQFVVVYDLGGGTFDVSILQIGDGVFEVKATKSDLFLGGEDIDFVLMTEISRRVQVECEVDLMKDPIARQRLKQAAEQAKISLSSADSVDLEFPFIHFDGVRPLHIRQTITREQFKVLIRPIIERTIDICKQALADAGVSTNDINQIVLVGGSTRIPLVKGTLREFFGKEPYGGLRREDAVALGAAIEGGVLNGEVKDVLLLDVVPLSIGIETFGGIFTRMIDRNTTIPTKKTATFSTAEDDQKAVTIRVCQGEREMAADNRLLGHFDLVDIPPAAKGTPQIEVTFDIDANGIVRVTACDKATGKEQSIRVQAPGGLSAEEIATMHAEARDVGISQIAIAPSVDAFVAGNISKREDTREGPSTATGLRSPINPSDKSLVIYLSYDAKDSIWADALEQSLALLTWSGRVVLHRISPAKGATKRRQILQSIEKCDVVIALISSDYLANRLTLSTELPTIFAEIDRRSLLLIPILARPCAIHLHEDLASFELFNGINSSLSSLEMWQAEAELTRLATHVAKLGKELTGLSDSNGVKTHQAVNEQPNSRTQGEDRTHPRDNGDLAGFHVIGSVVIATANEREASAVYDILKETSEGLGSEISTITDLIMPYTRAVVQGNGGCWEVFLVQADDTGGSDAVDLLRRALDRAKPDYIFFVGCAALLNERYRPEPNQVFVARSAYDADKHEISSDGAAYDMGQHRGDLGIIRNIEALKVSGAFDQIKVETRRHFVSGSVFMKDKSAKLRNDVLSRFPADAVVWEMEAFSVLKAMFNLRAGRKEVGLAIIKGISDFGDEEAQTEKTTKQRVATKNAMSVVATLLKSLSPI